MIISHKHKFIFIKTCKTAGTSLEIALSKYCGPDDIITPISAVDEQVRQSLGYLGPQHYLKARSEYTLADYWRWMRKREPISRFYNHIFAQDIQRLVPADVWNNYFRFSIVRNPFDRAVSRFFWRHRRGEVSPEQFRSFLFKDPEALGRNRKRTEIDGESVVDLMIRFEHLEEDLLTLSEKLGLPRDLYTEFKSFGAKKGHRPKNSTPKELFAGFDDGIELIMKVCKKDIEEFGYGPP
ncbi:sulfotransferase family 2 domain-containing protein [Alcanivorax limicola]|uniref:sulfotransferase family 2 domain-containing protein n=1 Tax=Alcanivorax limicola TaxID=2874102 RepID=UPI001CBEC10F|nr:sulfotransferase family 2 domain-containing protein [Alcanivorax limicola]